MMLQLARPDGLESFVHYASRNAVSWLRTWLRVVGRWREMQVDVRSLRARDFLAEDLVEDMLVNTLVYLNLATIYLCHDLIAVS